MTATIVEPIPCATSADTQRRTAIHPSDNRQDLNIIWSGVNKWGYQGMEWNAMEWSGTETGEREWNGMTWKRSDVGMDLGWKWNGVEWYRMEREERNGMEVTGS